MRGSQYFLLAHRFAFFNLSAFQCDCTYLIKTEFFLSTGCCDDLRHRSIFATLGSSSMTWHLTEDLPARMWDLSLLHIKDLHTSLVEKMCCCDFTYVYNKTNYTDWWPIIATKQYNLVPAKCGNFYSRESNRGPDEQASIDWYPRCSDTPSFWPCAGVYLYVDTPEFLTTWPLITQNLLNVPQCEKHNTLRRTRPSQHGNIKLTFWPTNARISKPILHVRMR